MIKTLIYNLTNCIPLAVFYIMKTAPIQPLAHTLSTMSYLQQDMSANEVNYIYDRPNGIEMTAVAPTDSSTWSPKASTIDFMQYPTPIISRNDDNDGFALSQTPSIINFSVPTIVSPSLFSRA